MMPERPTNPSAMAVDIESTGVDWTSDRIHGISVCYVADQAKYFPFGEIPLQVLNDLADPSIAKRGSNFHGFDAKFLRQNGVRVEGQFDDTMVIFNLLGELELDLKTLALKFIGDSALEGKTELDEYCKSVGVRQIAELCMKDLLDPNRPHTPVIGKYGGEDANNSFKLIDIGLEKLKTLDTYLKGKDFLKSPLDYYYDEARPLERVLFEMEFKGIRVDLDAIDGIRRRCQDEVTALENRLSMLYRTEIEDVEGEIVETARLRVSTEAAKAKRIPGVGKCKFYWKNGNHFGMFLRRFELPPELITLNKNGTVKADKIAILRLQSGLSLEHPLSPCLGMYANLKKKLKIIDTYTGTDKKGIISKIRNIHGTPRLYPVYRQTTETGRLACKNPNLQNLPRDSEVKRIVIPDKIGNVFDELDYSQVELRVAAHLSKDPSLLSAYRTGVDVHLQTACTLFGREITKADDKERQAGKHTNFLTIFDGQAYRLQSLLKNAVGVEYSLNECENFLKIWFKRYPDVRKYLDGQKEFFHKFKICISESGRVRRLPDVECRKWYKEKTQPDGTTTYRWIGPDDKFEECERLAIKRWNAGGEFRVCLIAKLRYGHALKAGYNQPIQGLAASLAKRAMIAFHNAGLDIRNQVHDSIVIERGPKDTAKLRKAISLMEQSYPMDVLAAVDVKTLKTFHPKDVFVEAADEEVY